MGLLDEYQIGVDGPWAEQEAAHLYRRAGFGAKPEEWPGLVGNGDQAALRNTVDALVNFLSDDPHLEKPAGSTAGTYGDPLADLPNDASDLGQLKAPRNLRTLGAYWLYRMRYTSQPLQEQLSVFFHDHFVSEFAKVQAGIPNGYLTGNDGAGPGQQCSSGALPPDAQGKNKAATSLMLAQNHLLRRQGADSFRQMLIDITRNPAMLLYLDNYRNRAGKPQENYAREVMELFSMGVGNYSEQDVQAVAKCLTGETTPRILSCADNYSLNYGFLPIIHETGGKTVFGQSIAYSNTGQETIDIIDLILDKVSVTPNVTTLPPPYNDLPAVAVYMAWKLLSWFVSHNLALKPTPNGAVLELADFLRGSDNGVYPERRFPYDIRAALRKIFLSRLFYDVSNRFTMYKTPCDFVVMALRMLDVAENFTSANGPFARMGSMGMTLFAPPNVAGWNHGRAWISSGSMVQRFNYANRIAEVVLGGVAGDAYISALLQTNGGPLASETDHDGMIEYFRNRLLQAELTDEEYDLLIAFLLGVTGANASQIYASKIRGLIHLMLTLPVCQLK